MDKDYNHDQEAIAKFAARFNLSEDGQPATSDEAAAQRMLVTAAWRDGGVSWE